MRITQVIGLPVGKASLQPLPPGKRSADKEERVGRKRQRLADACRHQVSRAARAGDHLQVHRSRLRRHRRPRSRAFQCDRGDRPLERGRGACDDRPATAAAGSRSSDMAAALTGKPVVAGDTIEEQSPPPDPGVSPLRVSGLWRTVSSKSSGKPSPRRQSSRQSAEHEALNRTRGQSGRGAYGSARHRSARPRCR